MFAVSTGQQSMVKILMAAGASLSELDSFHNTAQHFAVIHALPRMYSYVSEMLGRDWRPQKNVHGLSPMTLAVNLNKVNMFQHICAVQQRVVWNFGPVTCYDIPLVRIGKGGAREGRGKGIGSGNEGGGGGGQGRDEPSPKRHAFVVVVVDDDDDDDDDDDNDDATASVTVLRRRTRRLPEDALPYGYSHVDVALVGGFCNCPGCCLLWLMVCLVAPLQGEFDTVDWKEHKSVLAIATEMGHTDILQHVSSHPSPTRIPCCCFRICLGFRM